MCKLNETFLKGNSITKCIATTFLLTIFSHELTTINSHIDFFDRGIFLIFQGLLELGGTTALEMAVKLDTSK